MNWQPSLFDPGPCGYKRRGWLCRIGYPRSGLACKIRTGFSDSATAVQDPIGSEFFACSHLGSGCVTGSYLLIRIHKFLGFPDPDLFSQRCGSESFQNILRKTFISDVSVPSKNNKQKRTRKKKLFVVHVLEVTGEKSGIRSQIR